MPPRRDHLPMRHTPAQVSVPALHTRRRGQARGLGSGAHLSAGCTSGACQHGVTRGLGPIFFELPFEQGFALPLIIKTSLNSSVHFILFSYGGVE